MNQQHKRKNLPPTPPRGANGKQQSSVTPSRGNHTKKKGKTIDDAAPSASESPPNPADEIEFLPLSLTFYTEKYRPKSDSIYASMPILKKPTAASKDAETMADDGGEKKSARKYPNREEGTKVNNPILTSAMKRMGCFTKDTAKSYDCDSDEFNFINGIKEPIPPITEEDY